MDSRRFTVLASLILSAALIVPACNAESGGNDGVERSSTVPQRRQDANRAARAPEALTSAPTSPAELFEQIIDRARRLAQAEYAAPTVSLPDALTDLTYEQYRSIQSRPEKALWHDEGRFAVQLLHPGFLYRDPVRVHVVEDDRIVAMPFDDSLFRYVGSAASVAEVVTPDLDYAGFRVYYPLEDDSGRDEVVVFLGASYFRLLGADQVHGLSSRGLAVDIATDGGEEFPAFREFWLVRPEPEANSLTLYALLDSPSVTGAYRFDLEPGRNTAVTVDARIYARRDVGKLGVAPLSSMFLYGQNRLPIFDDFRPQVHDSDGLLMHTAADEWIWRPLSNGPGLQVTSLRDHTPRGFGLVQRDRRFDSYLDLEASYHRRPSEWVTVEDGDWGGGGVELLAIPTRSEFNDNIAVYWVPDQPFLAGDARRYQYRLTTFDGRLEAQTVAQVDRSRFGRDALPGANNPSPKGQRQFVIDFVDGALSSLSGEQTTDPRAVLKTSAGRTSDLVVQRLPGGAGWRAAFRLAPAGDRPADMRLYLEDDDRRLTETWTYVWYPDRAQ